MNELFDEKGNPKDSMVFNPTLDYLFGIKGNYNIRTRSMYINNFRHLLNLIISLFDYDGLDVPTYEFEYRLILQGYATIYKHPIYGMVTSWGGLYGVSIYNHYTNFVCTQSKLGSVHGKIGVNGAVFFDTPQDIQGGISIVLDRLRYYAKLLTDIDVSLDTYIINTRKTNAIVARDDQSREALEYFYEKMEEGENHVPLCASGVLPTHDSLLKSQDIRGMTSGELIEVRERVMRNFAEEWSIPKLEEKKERLVVDEIVGSKQFLNWNIYAMLQGRLNGLREYNRLYNKSAKLIFNRGKL